MVNALQRVYPYKMMLNKEGIVAVEDTMTVRDRNLVHLHICKSKAYLNELS